MLEILANGSKWHGQQPDTIDQLIKVLNNHVLDPRFEDYGDFIDSNPEWVKQEYQEKYEGCTMFFGNFLEVSHVFRVITDEQNIIDRLTKAILANKQTDEYKKYKTQKDESKQKMSWNPEPHAPSLLRKL
jgi:hypothetical protein